MDITLEKTLLYALKAGALLSTLIVLLRLTVEENTGFYGALLLAVTGSLSIIFLVFNALIFTNSKGLNNFGAFCALLVGLVIIGTSLFIVLEGENLSNLWDGGWNIVQFLVQLLLAGLAGIYLVFESGKRAMLLERLGLIIVIPLFILVQTISPLKDADIGDSWSFNGFTSVGFVTFIAIAVLFFSQLQHSIAVPLIAAMIAFVTNATSVKAYLFDDATTDEYYSYGSYGVELSPVVILQFAVSGLFLMYCAYIVFRTRNSETAH